MDLSVKQAAEELGYSVSQTRALIQSGKLKGKKNHLPSGQYYWTVSTSVVEKAKSWPAPTKGWKKGRKRS